MERQCPAFSMRRVWLCCLLVILLPAASLVTAAPIQGVIDAQTGSVSFSGLTGEIFIAIRGPQQLLRPQNQIDPPWFPEPPIPGEISLLGLGGIFGSVNFGNVVAPGLTTSQLAQIRMACQPNFVSEVIETPPSFVASAANIPADQGGLFVIIPEPAAAILATSAIAGLVLLRRRRHDHRAGRAHQ